MNFYDLKSRLNFPKLAGAITRKSDVVSLLELNQVESEAIVTEIDALSLNKNEDGSSKYEGAIVRLWYLVGMHHDDCYTIKKYLLEHKMTE